MLAREPRQQLVDYNGQLLPQSFHFERLKKHFSTHAATQGQGGGGGLRSTSTFKKYSGIKGVRESGVSMAVQAARCMQHVGKEGIQVRRWFKSQFSGFETLGQDQVQLA